MNTRLHSVLLTLWDIARGNPNYDRKMWSELQFLISDLDSRNIILCALMTDMLRAAESTPRSGFDVGSIDSPPEGYAMEFIRSELARRNHISAVDTLMNVQPPPIPTTLCGVVKRTSRNLGAPEPTPQSDDERYDEVDESLEDSSEELLFDFGSTD